MTHAINYTSINHNRSDYDAEETSFNDRLLNYIKENKPEGSLTDLLNQAKLLSPNSNLTLSQLNSALLYTDTILRADPNYQDYTSNTLDKQTTQMMGINMLNNRMMDKFTAFDEEQDFL